MNGPDCPRCHTQTTYAGTTTDNHTIYICDNPDCRHLLAVDPNDWIYQ